MKRNIIAGNWKMNMNNTQTVELIDGLGKLGKETKTEVVVCVPYTNLMVARKAIRGTGIKLGAQNVHWAKSGAFTGEISADMLAEQGVEYVIVGHSERRQYFNESNQTVNARAKAALDAGLKVIICVGETLDQREQGITEKVVTEQTIAALADISSEQLKKVVVAYEPVWAIGTGKTATADDANDTIAVIRKVVRKLYTRTIAGALRIQYGGSMNAGNAKELMAMPQIDGGLIGGASLKPADFIKVVQFDK